MVLAVHGDMALVRTDRSQEGQPVEVVEVQQGLDKLRRHRSVRVNVDVLGHRSSFVGAVLATLPDAQFTRNPAMVTLGAQAANDLTFAVLDGVASAKVRKEQAQLRNLLSGNRELASCALCGNEYPMGFLVAAHVEKSAQSAATMNAATCTTWQCWHAPSAATLFMKQDGSPSAKTGTCRPSRWTACPKEASGNIFNVWPGIAAPLIISPPSSTFSGIA